MQSIAVDLMEQKAFFNETLGYLKRICFTICPHWGGSRGAGGLGPLTPKNEAPAPKFYKIETIE